VTINNTGNAYTPVILEIFGTVNGNGEIQNITTNELITTVQPIGSGVVVEIDTKEHEVAVDGDAVGKRNYVDVLAEWFYLAPGNNVISFVDDGNPNNSSAYINVYYRSAWLG
jgi:phage-related protein